MPRRACHSVPLRPSAVCDGRAPRGGSARWGTTVCVGAQAAPHRRPHGPRRGPAVACPPSASAYDPSNLGGERAGGGALHQDGPCHPCPCGQPLTARWGQDELARRSPLGRAVQGRPATGQRAREKACSRGRTKPTRAPAAGREPPDWWPCKSASSRTPCAQASSNGAVCPWPYARAAPQRRTASSASPSAASPGSRVGARCGASPSGRSGHEWSPEARRRPPATQRP